jgi:quercetin dioxygenase-like cupin family protein
MHVTRFKDAPAYYPDAHVDMRCLYLQGKEAGPSDTLWMGMSQLLPGGHTHLTASPVEKFYLVIEGELTIETPTGSEVLGPLDTCRIAPGEQRKLINNTNKTVMSVLIMPKQ